MSFGNFETLGYEADSGVIHPIRVQPESQDGLNDSLLPIATGKAFFRRGGSRRKFGNFARYVTLSTVLGSASAVDPYTSARVYAKVTIFSKGVYSLLSVGDDYNYQGTDFTIVSKNPERVK